MHPSHTWPPSAARLTPKELEVLEQLQRGHSNKEIGRLLNKSPLTVKTQVQRLLEKFEVPNRTALVSRVAATDTKNSAAQST